MGSLASFLWMHFEANVLHSGKKWILGIYIGRMVDWQFLCYLYKGLIFAQTEDEEESDAWNEGKMRQSLSAESSLVADMDSILLLFYL